MRVRQSRPLSSLQFKHAQRSCNAAMQYDLYAKWPLECVTRRMVSILPTSLPGVRSLSNVYNCMQKSVLKEPSNGQADPRIINDKEIIFVIIIGAQPSFIKLRN